MEPEIMEIVKIDEGANFVDQYASCNKATALDGKTLLKCSGCRSTKYCSRGCQKLDWKIHKAFV